MPSVFETLHARRRVVIAVVWVALTIAIGSAIAHAPWRRAVSVLGAARWWWIAVAVLLNASILVLWAAEWRLLVPDRSAVGFERMFEIVSVTASVLNTVPFFAGETSAFALLVLRGGLTSAGAASVLALDQLQVGIGKVAVIGSAALATPLPAWLRAGVLAFCTAIAVLATALLSAAHGWTGSDHEPTGLGRFARARLLMNRLGRDLDALRSAHRFSRAVVLSLAKKGAELAAILGVQLALGVPLSVPAGLLVLAALALSTIVPIMPANVGVYEATVFACYRYFGVPADAALALAAAQHACFLLPSIAIGYATLTLRHLPVRLLRPRAP